MEINYLIGSTSGKHEFKIFQHYGYFAFDSAAVGLQSEPLTALISVILKVNFYGFLFAFLLQSNLNGSNIFRTMEIRSRHG